ncbi:DUF262 domain-containing protein [uncultured Paraglaciecola sp.]|uniref:DUF262 domain-containing protein n=1 Tax=uncultured Paraglaciecola sp. TaxID=1765024 RepID=UPI00260D2933|nr:DUF262 domain-containing protein [uncultured Paraglaciecola sp.]
MAIIDKNVYTVANLLKQPLAIPNYQRPYKWRVKHVNQLLDDIINHQTKSCYRLGTVVLYQAPNTDEAPASEDVPKGALSIVDGQQRLLTLTLICAVIDASLAGNKHTFESGLLAHSFKSAISINNLQHNAKVIESRVSNLAENVRQELLDFVLHKCELIAVTLDNLSEAFQFFDSQNARGKALAPYDLLKAYHLREMMQSTDETQRLSYVQAWEQGINPDNAMPSLHTIMGELLFRMRRWTDGDRGIQFSRHNIEVFKGVNLDSANYRYVEAMLALDYTVEKYNSDPIRQWDKQHKSYPFQVDQVMINGKRFFDYIQHYITMYFKLFSAESALLEKVVRDLTVYQGCNRKGDRYVKNLFLCAVMYYYDKFGDLELQKAAQLCFIWSYRLRLELQRIGIESVDNHARSRNGLFKVINKAIHPQQVLNMNIPTVESAKYKNAPAVTDNFKEFGYLHGQTINDS